MLTTAGKTALQLREDVEAALGDNPSLNEAKIGVEVTGGVVTLGGQVASYWQKVFAERDVARIAGVRGIVNALEVRTAADHTDFDIATGALEALDRNAQVPPGQVTVKVSDGWITLRGHVANEFQRRAAERAVRDLHGVAGVTNLIEIQPTAHVLDVRTRIEQCFERQALIDARHLYVTVTGQKVELRGFVGSWAERREAEEAAAATPGVTSVDNLIEVHA